MIKQVEDYTEDELSAKIEAIKAEREKTANALKRQSVCSPARRL